MIANRSWRKLKKEGSKLGWWLRCRHRLILADPSGLLMISDFVFPVLKCDWEMNNISQREKKLGDENQIFVISQTTCSQDRTPKIRLESKCRFSSEKKLLVIYFSFGFRQNFNNERVFTHNYTPIILNNRQCARSCKHLECDWLFSKINK